MVRARVLAIAMFCAAPALAHADRNVLVVLPFDDFAGRPDVARDLVAFAAQHAARRGYDVVYGLPVERVLEAQRVRYLDSLSGPALQRLLEELGADAIVLGALLSYRDAGNPSVVVSARMLGPGGAQAWSRLAGLKSSDTTGMLGLGTVKHPDALVAVAAKRLFADFPDPSHRPSASLAPKRRTPYPRPVGYRAPGFDPGRVQRVCVLPFENFTNRREAARILGELATRRVGERGGLRVVEAGDLRGAMIAEEIRSFVNTDSDQMKKLARRLDAPLFLRGAVYAYREPDGGGDPEVDVQLTLVNVESGEILWTSRLARRGADYMRLLQRGAISTAAVLADQALAEMVEGLFKS